MCITRSRPACNTNTFIIYVFGMCKQSNLPTATYLPLLFYMFAKNTIHLKMYDARYAFFTHVHNDNNDDDDNDDDDT